MHRLMTQLVIMLLVSAVAAAEPSPPLEAHEVRPVVAGSRLPAAMVQQVDGEPVSLVDALGQGRGVLMVYRGGWCPICSRHFADLGPIIPDLVEAGWRLVAVSPDSPESIAAWQRQHGEDGIVRLSDRRATAITALGLAFRLDAEALAHLAGFGIDPVAASGQTHHLLPVPAVLVVVDGEIRFLHADANYRRRLPAGLLQAAVAMIDDD